MWKNNQSLDNNLKPLCLIFELTNNYESDINKFSVNQNNQNNKYLLSYNSQTIQSNNKDEVQNKLNLNGFKNYDYIYWIKNVFEEDYSKYITIFNDLKKKKS